MAQRVQVNDVKDILDTGLSDTKIQNWIDIATLLIDQYASTCTTISAAILEKMEALLTAHLIASTAERDRHSVTSRRFGNSAATYGSAMTSEGLNGSPYGQQLKMLDSCGGLISLGKNRARSRLL